MHLRNGLLPRSSANNPLDNRAHSMANTSQAPDIEGLHREMHDIAEQIRIMSENNACLIRHLTTNNPPPPPTVPILKAKRSRRSQRSSDDESQSHQSTGRARNRRRQSPNSHLRRERSHVLLESRSSSQTPKVEVKESKRRGRSPHQDDQGYSSEVICQAFSAALKGSAMSWFKKLSPGTIDSFGGRVRLKNAFHLFTIHKKKAESLKDYVKWLN
ncbi:hypothetical protein Acr_05g0001120 [Actinidia rufa]|uniref:Retrotransposon gag domain-containing protein n=1 Tax=Actinidia rufa TaxID=165716 RepID=A0A7J0EJ28_9ERIC|nr:hypothetical protein Acr_05g0001120 [Actinidia rufa]